ncbi:tetratricopeptide repeat protein [Caulobacter sp. DWP3-1-3b2]|uniref:tetratricopeptide repeat protein n=1 Tax=Caulobacter sp. DWP3-1-3b2 TaxID=2804643 RepID=UPI003CED3473
MKSRKRADKAKRTTLDGRAIRNALFSFPNLRLGLSRVRQMLSAKEIGPFISEYWRIPSVRSQIVKLPFPSADAPATKEYVLARTSIEKALVWDACALRQYGDQLGRFSNLEREFYNQLMGGKLAAAALTLDRISAEFGQSKWLIEQKIHLLSEIGDITQLEAFVSSVAANSDNGVAELIAWFQSQKVDPEVSISRFYSYADRYAQAINDDSGYGAFLRWNIDRYHRFDVQNITGIIAFSETSSVIDRYVALKDVLSRLIALGQSIPEVALPDLSMLANALPGSDLSNIIAIADGARKDTPLAETAELEIFDEYSLGRYESALQKCLIILTSEPSKAHLYEICARSFGRCEDAPALDQTAPWARIVADMAAIFLRNSSYEEALNRLQRTSHVATVPYVVWATGSFLAREVEPDKEDHWSQVDAQSAACSQTGSPWHWAALDRAFPDAAALGRAYRSNPNSSAIRLQRALAVLAESDLQAAVELGVPEVRIDIYRGHLARKRGEFRQAAEAYSRALKANCMPDRLAAAKGKAVCLRALQDHTDALALVATQCLEIPTSYRLFDLPALLLETERTGLPAAYSTIALPILYNIYSKYYAADRDMKKSDSAEEYVFAKGARLPSELETPEGEIALSEHVYFLRYVCTPRAIDPFIDLENTSAVELERIAICQKLAEIDPGDLDAYTDEIREITRRRIVRERLKQVEKSKIFVDVPNIKRNAEKLLKENYSRFQESISRPDYDQAFIGMVKTIRELVGDKENIVHFPDHPIDEREQSFRKLCGEVINLLLLSQEYGFKTYLSTRIKHGTLAAQLSSPFSLNNLLLEANDGVYTQSNYWQKQLSLDDMQAATLHLLISEFSRDIDGIIESLKDQNIQILSDAFPEAWLDFTFFRNEILFLQAQIDTGTTFEQFFDIVLTRFWRALNDNLTNVRSKLDGVVKPALAQRLDLLQQEVVKSLPGASTAPLHSAIAAARTEAQNSVDVIIGWFKLTQAADRPDYEFGIAVDVAAESINSCFKSKQITVVRDIEVNRELKGTTLESMVDILFILFENAITHSHGGSGSTVTLRAAGGENVLLLEVENSVIPQTDFEPLNVALRERLGKVSSASGQAMVAQEGGSGFPKIVKILKHDLSGTSVIRAKFVNSTTFRTDIEFESARIFI